ncbi:MAG: hypothetical protein P4L22_03410 [Candidatus Babeliales bacterium]|nr:hypothetical protein [Candidatus Babeliales bacterium]
MKNIVKVFSFPVLRSLGLVGILCASILNLNSDVPKCGKVQYFDRLVVRDFIKVGTLDAQRICLSGCSGPIGCGGNTGARAACTIGGGCPTGMTCINGECFPTSLIGNTGATGATGSRGTTGFTGVTGLTGATGATGVLSAGSLVFTVTDMHKLVTASAAPELSLAVTYSTPTAPLLAWKMLTPILGVDLTPISLVFQVPADYDASIGSMTVTLNIILDTVGSIIGDMANVRVSAAFETNNTVITTATAYADQVTTGAFAVNPPTIPGIRYLQKSLTVDTSLAVPGDWAVLVFDRVSAGGLFTDAAYIGLSNVNITYPRA